MRRVLRYPIYARLFAAQVVALLGTGLATVALGLTAYGISPERAGAILGLIFTVKMVAYVGVAPLATALLHRVPRRAVLVGADVTRAVAALCLLFVRDVTVILLLVFVLQASSATFTPTFQGIIPQVLPEEQDYTHALSLSRLAYEVESIVSPILAAALLAVVRPNTLFLGTTLGFVGSALLVLAAAIPRDLGRDLAAPATSPRQRIVRGASLFFMVRELRPILALNLVVASTIAFVLVHTVVIVQTELGLGESWVPLFLAFQGAGSIATALALPRVLRIRDPQAVVFPAAVGLVLAVALTALLLLWRPSWLAVAIGSLWCLMGACWSAVSTPLSLLIRRAVPNELLTEAFAGQFSLSHACWLAAYPTIGVVGAVSLPSAALLGSVTGAGALVGAVVLAHRATAAPAPEVSSWQGGAPTR